MKKTKNKMIILDSKELSFKNVLDGNVFILHFVNIYSYEYFCSFYVLLVCLVCMSYSDHRVHPYSLITPLPVQSDPAFSLVAPVKLHLHQMCEIRRLLSLFYFIFL